jgi:hypothetical protein
MKLFERLVTENEKLAALPAGLVACFIRAQEEHTDYCLYKRGGHARNILPFKTWLPLALWRHTGHRIDRGEQ